MSIWISKAQIDIFQLLVLFRLKSKLQNYLVDCNLRQGKSVSPHVQEAGDTQVLQICTEVQNLSKCTSCTSPLEMVLSRKG